jgi:hypothetical protein
MKADEYKGGMKMDQEKQIIHEIAEMDDAALRDGLKKVAESMGIAPEIAGMYLSDLEKVRETVLGLTAEDLQAIRSNLGDESMDRILENLRRS